MVVLTLVPLAHASPVDPTWIAGLYDNGDGDDIMLLITNGDAPPIPTGSFIAQPSIIVPVAPESDTPARRGHDELASERAPPTV